jgi:hypothetical protein
MMDFFRSFFEDIFSENRPAGTVAAILLFQHYQRPPKQIYEFPDSMHPDRGGVADVVEIPVGGLRAG